MPERMISEPEGVGGLHISLAESDLKKEGIIAAFPLKENTEELEKKWFTFNTFYCDDCAGAASLAQMLASLPRRLTTMDLWQWLKQAEGPGPRPGKEARACPIHTIVIITTSIINSQIEKQTSKTNWANCLGFVVWEVLIEHGEHTFQDPLPTRVVPAHHFHRCSNWITCATTLNRAQYYFEVQFVHPCDCFSYESGMAGRSSQGNVHF